MDRIGRLFAWSFVRAPFLANLWARTRRGWSTPSFVPPRRPLSRMRIGLVTTGGLHQEDQIPFRSMAESPDGDGTFRRLNLDLLRDRFVITHDWYDHRDAERDLNLILPAERLREIAKEGIIGSLHTMAVGLMGHVEGEEERRLERETASAIAELFRRESVDAVLLVPA